jgi:hypothetical protein
MEFRFGSFLCTATLFLSVTQCNAETVNEPSYEFNLPDGWVEKGRADASAPLVGMVVFQNPEGSLFGIITGKASQGLTPTMAVEHEISVTRSNMKGEFRESELTQWGDQRLQAGAAIVGTLFGTKAIMRYMAFQVADDIYVIIEGGSVEKLATESASAEFKLIRDSFKTKQ